MKEGDGAVPDVSAADVGTTKDPMWFSIADDPIVQWIRANLVIASAAIAFLLVVVEVLQLARWRVESALAIVAVADAPRVVSGVAVAVLPLMLPPLVLLSWAWYRELRATGHRAGLLALLEGPLLGSAILVSPVSLLVIYFGIYVVTDWVAGFLTRRRGTPVRGYMPVGERRTSYFVFVAVFAVSSLLLNSRSWLPVEVVGVTGGVQVSGFVVGETASFTTVVGRVEGSVSRVKTDSIITRTVCHTESGWFFDSILESVSPRISPICP